MLCRNVGRRTVCPRPANRDRFTCPIGQLIQDSRGLNRRFPAIAHGEKSDSYKNHLARKLPPHHLRIVEAVPANGGSRRDVADTSNIRRTPAHKDVFGQLTCSNVDALMCGRFIHRAAPGYLTAAALQSFDDQYEFFGEFWSKPARSATPAVRLAKLLGDSMLETHARESRF